VDAPASRFISRNENSGKHLKQMCLMHAGDIMKPRQSCQCLIKIYLHEFSCTLKIGERSDDFEVVYRRSFDAGATKIKKPAQRPAFLSKTDC
jgi:hypothetical protein